MDYTNIKGGNMKAAQISDYGDSSQININEVVKPELKDSQVLVEVHASSLNPFDSMVRSGYLKDAVPLELPFTLGGDIAGIVVEVGADAKNMALGDKVYGQANVVAGNSGALAEFSATSSEQIAKMPSNLDFEQAASLPLVGVSALQAIYEHLELKSGQKILIHGGAGGIGAIAIQIAKNLGAYVAVTATGDAISFVKDLGADEVIDYKTENFSTIVSDYDAVFDTVGGDDFVKSYAVLKQGGKAVSMIAPADEAKANEYGITALTQSTKVTTEALDKLSELVEAGVVKPNVYKILPLSETRQAFDLRESGQASGKVVINIKE
jgi:NADPH:quinone reductase-like Zn-dependent oxidoreductase